MGLADPRSYGSKNPGATNVLRSGNKAAALLTLAFDALKGYVPVLAGPDASGRASAWATPPSAFVGLAAFIGHLWPVFFRFQGGKGVATAAGVLLALNPWLGLATLLSWVIIAAFFRYSSLASIVAALFAPFYQLLIWGASSRGAGHRGDEPAAGLAPRGQHPQAAGGHRVPARPEGGAGRTRGPMRVRTKRRTGTPILTSPRKETLMVQRFDVGARMSEMAVHNGVCYLAGQVAATPRRTSRPDAPGAGRHRRAAGARRHRQDAHPARARSTWPTWPTSRHERGLGAWVVAGHTPPRATVQAALAKPEWKVEIVVTAAL
jgi:acyl-phosphate glycerol 3-phosphate acyltransferase